MKDDDHATLPGPGVAGAAGVPVDVRAHTLPAAAHAATLPASDLARMPHAATLPGPYAEADFSGLQPVPASAYTLGAEVARGGMGKILAARDRRLRRDLVIKVTRDGGPVDPRFEREALITARLQHPSIVRVYEAGLLDDGRAFYAMERVRGRTLENVVDDAKLVRDRLALLPHAIAVADAIAYAHSELVLHRDLKPSNVLIGPFGETVVIDWGLAKDLRQGETAESLAPAPTATLSTTGSSGSLTQIGAVMGTPSFMAPEQARGDASDERTDIYSLGAVIYALLAGVPPHRGLTNDEVLAQVTSGTRVPLAVREPSLPPELVTIVERAMAQRPDDRYQRAQDLASDLRAFAAGKLVAVHAYSAWRLARRFLRRHKLTVAVAAVALVVLAAVGALSLSNIVRARDEAAAARAQAEHNLRELHRSTDQFYRDQAAQALAADPSHTAAWLGRMSDRALDEPETLALARTAATQGLAWELRGHTADVELVAVSPDGTTIATGSDDSTVRLWSVADHRVRVLRGHVGPIEAIAYADDGRHLASAGTDGTVWLWDTAAATGTKLVGHRGSVRGVAFSPNSAQLASTSEDGTLFLWDVATATGKVLLARAHGLRPVIWTRDGATVIVGGYDGIIARVDVRTGKSVVKTAYAAELRCFALDRDGTLLATGDEDGSVRLWTSMGDPVATLTSHTDVVRNLVFTPDNAHLVTSGGDKIVRVYAVADRKAGAAIELRGNNDGIKGLAVSADSQRVASAGIDGIVRVWPITGGPAHELRGHGTAVKGVAFVTPDLLVSAAEDDIARLWNLAPAGPPPSGPALRAWFAARTNVVLQAR